MELENQVREIIAQHIGHDPSDIVNGVEFQQELGLDDLDIIQLAMALEDAFGIQMSDEQTNDCTTLDGCVQNVRALLKEAA